MTDLRLVDEQTLMQGTRRGPRARVEAVAYAHRLPHERLVRGALLARFVSDGESSVQGLRRGVQYLFVDSVAGAGWRAIMVHDDPALRPIVGSLFLTDTLHHRPPGSLVPASRWIESRGFLFPNVPCEMRCCVPCFPPRAAFCPSGPLWPPMLDIDSLVVPDAPVRPDSPTVRPPA